MRQLPTDGAPRQVTILIHTANRPEHLFRLLRYYAAYSDIDRFKILVADGSTDRNAAVFDGLMRAARFKVDVTIQRGAHDRGFVARLLAACAVVETDHVLLAADDDFYFLDWVQANIGLFDRADDVTAIIGNYLVFGFDRFAAFSDRVSVVDGGPERFSIPWLEGDTAADRVAEVGANTDGIQTIAWYAVHRAPILTRILRHAGRYDLPAFLFERFFTIAQAASGKTVFSPRIFLARQADADPAHLGWRTEPPGFTAHRAAIARFETCTRSFLTDELAIPPDESARLVEIAFGHELRMMRQADRRRMLRRVVNRLSVRRWLTALRTITPPAPRDPRLPQRCDAEELERRGEEIRRACLPDPASDPSRNEFAGDDQPAFPQ